MSRLSFSFHSRDFFSIPALRRLFTTFVICRINCSFGPAKTVDEDETIKLSKQMFVYGWDNRLFISYRLCSMDMKEVFDIYFFHFILFVFCCICEIQLYNVQTEHEFVVDTKYIDSRQLLREALINLIFCFCKWKWFRFLCLRELLVSNGPKIELSSTLCVRITSSCGHHSSSHTISRRQWNTNTLYLNTHTMSATTT